MLRVARGLARTLLSWVIVLSTGAGASAQDAARGPVVVELFTSQACAACPPADAFFSELAKDPGILPLALHVDYWDYIGWADRFAQSAFTMRQKNYAHAAGRGMVYTPQIIVAGRMAVAGTKQSQVRAAIADERDRAPVVRIDVGTRPGGELRVLLVPLAPIAPSAEVIVVRYAPLREMSITRGENAGHTFRYVNVVTDWTVLGAWDGQAAAEFVIPARAEVQPGAVLVQAAGYGPILSAARLD